MPSSRRVTHSMMGTAARPPLTAATEGTDPRRSRSQRACRLISPATYHAPTRGTAGPPQPHRPGSRLKLLSPRRRTIRPGIRSPDPRGTARASEFQARPRRCRMQGRCHMRKARHKLAAGYLGDGCLCSSLRSPENVVRPAPERAISRASLVWRWSRRAAP
jgi:hypothetical protein